MSPERRSLLRLVPWVLWLLTLVLAVGVVTLSLLTPAGAARRMPADPDLRPGFRDYWFPVESLAFATVGALVLSRRRNLVGWLMCVVGPSFLIADVAAQRYIAYASFVHPLPGVNWVAWLNAWIWIPDFGLALIGLPLLFPNGRPLTRRWRVLGWGAVGFIALFTLLAALSPTATRSGSDGLAVYPVGGGITAADVVVQLIGIAFLGMVALSLAAGVSLVLRYRRADAEERHQIKWITAAFIMPILALPIGLLPLGQVGLVQGVLTNLTQITVIFLPLSIGMAVLKYRLYDIDVVISRALVYASLAIFITAVYVGIAVGIGSLIGSAGKPNLLLSVVATAVVALAFQPLRERLNRIANRLVYGRRATPYEVLSQFSQRVAETYAAEETLPRMARVLAEGTGAAHADVWLRSGSVLRPAATWPEPSEAVAEELAPVTGQLLPTLPGDRVVPVLHQDELLGALTVTKRQGEALTPIENKLLDDLAHQAGLVLKNVGLTAELLARLEELRASRQRLVVAQDDERRRLERNLHDGAQQSLVALKVRLGLVQMVADRDPAKAREMVVQLKGDADEALETLRDLARGIYPPLLADKGLVVALQSQARKATIPVEVQAEGVSRYPQDLEAAVYFCVLEALQNIQKYAQASHAWVRLAAADDRLSLEVEDDGRGFDAATVSRGAGLTNMADRLDALGGSIEVESSPGAGARLRARLPIPAAVPA